jgi:hypothetical protein
MVGRGACPQAPWAVRGNGPYRCIRRQLEAIEFAHLLEVTEGFLRFLRIDCADGDADVDENIVAEAGFGCAGKADELDHTGKADLGGAEKRVVADDFDNFTGDCETHGGGWLR